MSAPRVTATLAPREPKEGRIKSVTLSMSPETARFLHWFASARSTWHADTGGRHARKIYWALSDTGLVNPGTEPDNVGADATATVEREEPPQPDVVLTMDAETARDVWLRQPDRSHVRNALARAFGVAE